jgi:hypothetical protein
LAELVVISTLKASSAAVLTPEKADIQKGNGRDPENIGTTVAIMRIIGLIPW